MLLFSYRLLSVDGRVKSNRGFMLLLLLVVV